MGFCTGTTGPHPGPPQSWPLATRPNVTVCPLPQGTLNPACREITTTEAPARDLGGCSGTPQTPPPPTWPPPIRTEAASTACLEVSGPSILRLGEPSYFWRKCTEHPGTALGAGQPGQERPPTQPLTCCCGFGEAGPGSLKHNPVSGRSRYLDKVYPLVGEHD